MERLAPTGDAWSVAEMDDLPRVLADPAAEVTVSRRYYGYAVRTDRWQCRGLARDQHMIYLILEGEVPGRVGGQPFTLGPNTLFWLSPGEPHDMTWPDRLAFTEVWFSLRHGGRSLRLPEPALVLDEAGELWPILRQIEDELTLDGPLSPQMLRHLLAMLAIGALRLRLRGLSEPHLTPDQRRRLVAHARRHLRERPTPAELAEVVGLSPDYFTRVFTRTFGCPPRDWLVRERIREATRLLTTTNLTVYQVADHLGYANVSQFHRQFRSHAGVSPRRYRARHGA